MTTWIMFDSDISPDGVTRRLREEMARRGIPSDSHAAKMYGKHPQQWVSRRMNADTDWKLQELHEFCDVLTLDYVYVTTGIRTVPDGGGGAWSRLGESNPRPIHYRSRERPHIADLSSHRVAA